MAERRAPARFFFSNHVVLLNLFLSRRNDIVERIEHLLNAQRHEIVHQIRHLLDPAATNATRRQEYKHFEKKLNACFFGLPGLSDTLVRLEGELSAKRLADGLRPFERSSNGDCDPLELIARAIVYWDNNRWPGRNGRLKYAHTIYSVFVLQQLEHLWLRAWDDGNSMAGNHFAEIQGLLNRLNDTKPANCPVCVRDARWLLQTAQSPITRELRPYFVIAEHVRKSFSDFARLEIHKAGARMAGGHVRSQMLIKLRGSTLGIRDPEFLSGMRSFSAMDNALLVYDLVPLLEAYEAAFETDTKERQELADTILQGISTDPNLFLTRLDLLTPYTTIEDIFIECDRAGHARYSDIGRAHMELLERYGQLMGRVKGSLMKEGLRLDPSQAVYSPYGMAYGFSSELLNNIALSTLAPQYSLALSLEDVFSSDRNVEKELTWVMGCEELPGLIGERRPVEYSNEFAKDIFDRMMSEFHVPVQYANNLNARKLFVIPEPMTVELLQAWQFPEGIEPRPVACLTTDPKREAGTIQWKINDFVNDRHEGKFLASCKSEGGWFGVPKGLLTLLLGQGEDALVIDVPEAAIEILRLTCPYVVVLRNSSVYESYRETGRAN